MKVSVIIPSYNRFRYLENAIRSVKSQTHNNTEIIVINDGSTEHYYSSVPYILPPNAIYVNMNQNSSNVVDEGRAAYTRNIGIKLATGDYVAFLDDDDVWFPEKLELQLKEMEKHNCLMSCSEALIGNGVYREGVDYPKYIVEYHRDFYNKIGIKTFPNTWNKNFLLKHNSCITSSVIIHKSIIDKIGLMPHKRVGEDYEYWLRALDHTDCAFIPRPLMYYDNNHGDGSLY